MSAIEYILVFLAAIAFVGGIVIIAKADKVSKHNKRLKEENINRAKTSIPLLIENLSPKGVKDSIQLLKDAGVDREVIKNFSARRHLISESIKIFPSSTATQAGMEDLVRDIMSEVDKL